MAWIRSLSTILHDPQIEPLGQKVMAYERLRKAVLSELPALLKASVQISPIENETLTLRCANGTVHMRLRILKPAIEDAVRAAGFSLAAIHLKVEPMVRPVEVVKPKLHRVIPEKGRIALERMRQQCEGTPLAGALARLLEGTYTK